MRHLTFLFTLIFLSLGLTSCLDDENDLTTPDPLQLDQDEQEDRDVASQPDIPDLQDALLQHIQQHTEDVESPVRETVIRPDGTEETVYLVEGDIELTKEQFQQLSNPDISAQKQYRSTNRVNGYQTYTVVAINSGSYGLTPTQITGLRYAVENYNNLNLTIKLELQTGSILNTLFSPFDIMVYHDGNTSSATASAGFPAGGKPYKYIRVYDGLNGESDQVAEHVLAHELGHCLGLRHTDWFNRSYSCGTGGSERSGTTGAVHIPGTPTGYDSGSILNACWWSSTNGEFSYYDRVALNWLF